MGDWQISYPSNKYETSIVAWIQYSLNKREIVSFHKNADVYFANIFKFTDNTSVGLFEHEWDDNSETIT